MEANIVSLGDVVSRPAKYRLPRANKSPAVRNLIALSKGEPEAPGDSSPSLIVTDYGHVLMAD